MANDQKPNKSAPEDEEEEKEVDNEPSEEQTPRQTLNRSCHPEHRDCMKQTKWDPANVNCYANCLAKRMLVTNKMDKLYLTYYGFKKSPASLNLSFKSLIDAHEAKGKSEASSSSTNSSSDESNETNFSNDSGFAVENFSPTGVLVKKDNRSLWKSKYLPTRKAAKSRRRSASPAESLASKTNCKRKKIEKGSEIARNYLQDYRKPISDKDLEDICEKMKKFSFD
ncbi:hypothetical protein TSAR_017068 [Trichomalopsis sarcophagae]|uniref:Uncharacterized protein n=1 Tax=Trichomalopsis sarcophagae TaxID=543379 RepID=A0A232EIN7_9HYME|nr:hypothetical protein TSAR_017068 [Trichomalopsis sarcophagae]